MLVRRPVSHRVPGFGFWVRLLSYQALGAGCDGCTAWAPAAPRELWVEFLPPGFGFSFPPLDAVGICGVKKTDGHLLISVTKKNCKEKMK